ncbi:MAG TPA: HAD family hydrolase [Elainellaceae cyanobacterium]
MVTLRCNTKDFYNIQAVLFDKDGTLADSYEFLRNLGQKRSRLIDAQIPGVQEPLLMAFGIDSSDMNPAGLLAVGTRIENEIAAAAYVAETGRDWIESLNIVRNAFEEADRYMNSKAEQTPLFDGAVDLLTQLSHAGLKLGILSSDTTHNVNEFVNHYRLGPLVQLQMGVDEGPAKPDPRLVDLACKDLMVSPQTTLLIGDSQADIQLAHAAKMAGCIGVTWGWSRSIDLTQADVLADQCSDIRVVR